MASWSTLRAPLYFAAGSPGITRNKKKLKTKMKTKRARSRRSRATGAYRRYPPPSRGSRDYFGNLDYGGFGGKCHWLLHVLGVTASSGHQEDNTTHEHRRNSDASND